MNRNFLHYLVTDTNGCKANVISKLLPYLCLALPYKSIASHTCAAIRSWDEWQIFLSFMLQFCFFPLLYSQFFLLYHFSEDILKELQVMDTSRCSLHQLKEQSSEKEQRVAWLTSYSRALWGVVNLPLWVLELSRWPSCPFTKNEKSSLGIRQHKDMLHHLSCTSEEFLGEISSG